MNGMSLRTAAELAMNRQGPAPIVSGRDAREPTMTHPAMGIGWRECST
jgi:hypothetical protein